ncbi:DUF2726 domain-containing protein [Noviherbaspirillum massiliense]|uniref:DUF2726 domain-containing protein n=1 Tax=Noviherbaspirillum massiliense TaxID=1465823 RepID=UPI0003629B57|nr:DUF2726 domain-containing protein [Noviherbaspirillum massiliense]
MKEMIFVGAVVAVIGALALRFVFGAGKIPRYHRKPVLLGAELDFFYLLQRALPECHVFPGMALAALIEPQGMGKLRMSAYERIAARRVGYAVFDKEMQVLAVVELSPSRSRRRESKKEAYLASAGIRTVHFHPGQFPSEARIQRTILANSPQSPAARMKVHTRIHFARRESGRVKTPWRNTLNAHR